MSISSNSSFPVDPALAVKSAQDQEMVRRKMEIDALRKRLGPEQDPKGKLREACEGFETIFIQKIWEQMRNGVPKEGYLHSKQEAMYQSMYDHEFSKKMAAAGGIGLADMLYEQLSQSLGESSRSASPGINPRLPIVPAGSSPGSLKYAENTANAEMRPASLPGNIKPLYEDFDENADLRQFALPGRGGAPLDYAALDISRQRPLSVQQTLAASAETALGPAAANTEPAGVSGAYATNLTAAGLDFEALSHETMLQETMRQEAAARESGAPGPAVERPVSAYAQAFNRRINAASALSPEETRILQEALRENARGSQAGENLQADQVGTSLSGLAAGSGPDGRS